MIRALIFDFDGLILDTETPDLVAWQEIYQDFGFELPLSGWTTYVGGTRGLFDPYDYLEEQMGEPIDRPAIRARHRVRDLALIAQESIQPGVIDYLADASRLGLKVAIASSSPRDWVVGHLDRLGLLDQFNTIFTADEVTNTKPDPELFRKAVEAVGETPERAIALEDSPNGVTAAQRAGLFCVVVPNSVTRLLPIDHADLIVESLAAYPLEKLLETVQALSS